MKFFTLILFIFSTAAFGQTQGTITKNAAGEVSINFKDGTSQSVLTVIESRFYTPTSVASTEASDCATTPVVANTRGAGLQMRKFSDGRLEYSGTIALSAGVTISNSCISQVLFTLPVPFATGTMFGALCTAHGRNASSSSPQFATECSGIGKNATAPEDGAARIQVGPSTTYVAGNLQAYTVGVYMTGTWK